MFDTRLRSVPMIRECELSPNTNTTIPRTAVPVSFTQTAVPQTPFHTPNYTTARAVGSYTLPPIQSLTQNILPISRGSGSASPLCSPPMLRVPERKERRNSINIGALCQDHDAPSLPSLPTPGDSTSPASRKSSVSSDAPVYNNGEKYNQNGELIGRTGKPLRNTKRAAQNRSAQKAFRQRREKYIKALEEKARLYDDLLRENMELKARLETRSPAKVTKH